MSKFCVCIYESKKNTKRFLEVTEKKLSDRLKEINKGIEIDKEISKNIPYKIIYSETYKTKKEAEERLKFLKSEPRIFQPIPKKLLRK
jgi:DNA-binding HxlR family transcriptional regulator